jgi:hypothetical protein
MNTLTDTATAAFFEDGQIIVRMESGAKISFPIAKNPRLARGSKAQLNNIEISPLGLHWPELDEDLSFNGLLEGNHGQFQKKTVNIVSHKYYPKGLDGRERDESGQLREKHGDTRIGTLREKSSSNFAKGYRSDTKLSTVRKDTGKSLGKPVKKK